MVIASPPPAAIAATARSNQYLTLHLGDEEYALDILRVQEIRSYEEPTRMVGAPAFIAGVVNLRGVIVPIADLRLLFRLEQAQYNDFTVVIVLNLGGAIVGVVVDAVSDVVTLGVETLKPAPDYETEHNAGFISGLASLGERMLIVLNMDALLGQADLGLLRSGPH